MMRRHSILCICIGILVAFWVQNAALAQSDGDGAVMTARSYRPIPDGARLEIQIADDSDINLRLLDIAVRALTRAGYTVVSEKPAFTLRLETERLVSGAAQDRSIGSLRAGSGVGRPTGNVGGPQGTGVDLNLKLWSSSRNSLLSPKSAGTAPKQGFGLRLDAFDESAGKPAWQGAARTQDNEGDDFRTGSALIRHLIDAVGLTIEAETVSIR
jgi:hypothetical protein